MPLNHDPLTLPRKALWQAISELPHKGPRMRTMCAARMCQGHTFNDDTSHFHVAVDLGPDMPGELFLAVITLLEKERIAAVILTHVGDTDDDDEEVPPCTH